MSIMKNSLIDELFDRGKAYTAGILCTYSLDIEFLENFLLRLDGFTNCSDLCIFTDRNVYEKLFEDGKSINYRWINKRYFLIPIDVHGVFHPKIYILASEKYARIGIGSANLTREGLSSNLEVASVFEVNSKDKAFSSVLNDIVKFLNDLVAYSESTIAHRFISSFNEIIQGLKEDNEDKSIHVLHNLNDSILLQAKKLMSQQKVNAIKVFSPFYDKKMMVYRQLKKNYPMASIQFYIQQGKTNFPVDEFKLLDETSTQYIIKNHERYMHGKVLIFDTESGFYVLTGSSNFTSAALLSSKKSGNIELSLFGSVKKGLVNEIINPAGYKPIVLRNFDNLETMSAVQDEQIQNDIQIIKDWLIEVLLSDNHMHIGLRKKEGLTPTHIFFNGNKKNGIKYSEKIELGGIKKTDVIYSQVQGIDKNGNYIESGKVWVIDLNANAGSVSRKRYTITDPTQITDILKGIIENGTEEELIEYLYRFNIPLDLSGIFSRRQGLRAMESLGNIFGRITAQQRHIWNSPNLLDAVKYFLGTHYKKLQQHHEDVQLNHINNFMLIFSTIFGMMETIHELILLDNDYKSPIKATDWSMMRNLYDTFLQYSSTVLNLLWLQDKTNESYENRVNMARENDSQKMLGSISRFKEYIFKMDYDYYLKPCYQTVKSMCWNVDNYIRNGSVLTLYGKKVRPPVSRNGYSDNYIRKRVDIYKYAEKLYNALKKDKR